MTVCIAAIAQRLVITASDRMLSTDTRTFPGAVPKTRKIGPQCVLLFAGDMGYEDEIVAACETDEELPVQTHFERVKEATEDVRMRLTKETILRPLGLPDDLQPRIDDRLSESDQSWISSRMANVSLGLSFIVAGADNTGGHIYTVEDGQGRCWDSAGYVAIGTGAEHAIASLAQREYTREITMHAGLFLVYEAKRRAELSPTVGDEIDLCSIGAGHINLMSSHTTEKFKQIYQKKILAAEKRIRKKVAEALGIEGEVLEAVFPEEFIAQLRQAHREATDLSSSSTEPEQPSEQSPDDEPPTAS